MGITYTNKAAAVAGADGFGTQANKTAFTSRARVTFTLTGETDGGLAFGGSFRADNAGGAAAGTAGSVFVSGDFGKLTMGDTAGAAQFVVGHVSQMSLTAFGDLNEILYLGNNTDMGNARPVARYEYSMDGFTFAASHSNPGNARKVWSLAAGYSFDGFKVGIGYESQNAAPEVTARNRDVTTTPITTERLAMEERDKINHLVVGAEASFEGITGKIVVGRASGAGATDLPTKTQGAISLSGSFDEITVTAFGRTDFNKDRHFGLGASYDLGGGASLRGGIVNTRINATPDAGNSRSRTQADFGLNFTF
jgi:outer membrane protein OmpU